MGSKEERMVSSKQNRVNAELVTVIPINHQVTTAVFCYVGTFKMLIYPSEFTEVSSCAESQTFLTLIPQLRCILASFLQTACTDTSQ